MRPTITALLLCASAWAAPTTIVGTFSLPGGAPATGAAFIVWGRFTTFDGRVIPGGTLSVPIRSGHLSTALEPNDTALPTGTVYTVTYSFRQGTGETWVVPTSGSPVDVTAIATTVPLPPPDTIFALTQIAGGGATAGQYLTWDGTYWHPGNGPNPGGSTNQIQYKSNSTTFAGFTMSGYCTIVVATGVITCRGPDVGTAGVPISDGAAWTAASNAQITAKVNTFTSSLPGAVPASGGTSAALCLNQQGTWSTCAGGGGGGGGTNPTSLGLQYWQTGSSTWRVATSGDLTTLLTYTPLNLATLGQPSGPAQLDSGGRLTSAVLPTIGAGGSCALLASQSCGFTFDTVGRMTGAITNAILIDETGLSLSNVTTMNASTARHGFQKQLNGNALTYADGSGNYSVPVGSVTTNTSSSVVGEISLFQDTSGKVFKRSTLTGVLVSASGVASVATGTSTNCVHVDGTSAACGGGGGTSVTSGLTDWTPSRTPTVITFGSGCVPGAECRVRIGQTSYALAGGPYTCTLANSHTGDLHVYINPDTQAVVCGTNTALNGDITPSASATTVGSVAAMCSDCGQLFTWHVTSGAFDSTVTARYDAYLSIQPTPIAGFDIQIVGGNRPTISASPSVNTVAFSATPVFDLSAGSIQRITLTGNVTSSTLTNVQVGRFILEVCQDATGSRTFVAPTNLLGFTSIGASATALKCSAQAFLNDGADSNLRATAAGVLNQ